MRRALRIDVPEGIDASLAKELVITAPRAALTIAKSLLYFEERKDGTWRLTHTNILFPDFAQVKRFVFEGVPKWPKLPLKNLKMHIEGTNHVWDIAAVIGVESKPGERFMRFDMERGKWKLVLSHDLLDCVTTLTSFTMIRED